MRHLFLFAGLLAGLTLTGAATAADSNPQGWCKDYATAQALSKRLNRPMLVHFYGEQCPPCRRLEREVLNTPEMVRLLQTQFVGVKVCVEKNRELSRRYNVGSVPVDKFVSPDGRLFNESTGYKPKTEYCSHVAMLAAAGKRLAPVPQPRVPEDRVIVQKPAARPATPKIPEDPMPPEVAEDEEELVATAPSESTTTPGRAVVEAEPEEETGVATVEALPAEIAMDGFCPVSLFKSRSWTQGKEQFSHEYEGQVYWLSGADQLAAFKADPPRYAPRLLGCDPVLLTETNEAVPGSTKFGAVFDGSLYLFKDGNSRKRFREDPAQFTKTQQVKLDDKKSRG